MKLRIRNFHPTDAPAVDSLAVAAFEEYRKHYSDWPSLEKSLSDTSLLSKSGEVIVAECNRSIVGSVVYVGKDGPKSQIFEPHWPIMRMLVVHPNARRVGIGRALAEECISRAQRDGAAEIALHTAPIMQVARLMYERMGFVYLKEGPNIHGVPYAIYIKRITA